MDSNTSSFASIAPSLITNITPATTTTMPLINADNMGIIITLKNIFTAIYLGCLINQLLHKIIVFRLGLLGTFNLFVPFVRTFRITQTFSLNFICLDDSCQAQSPCNKINSQCLFHFVVLCWFYLCKQFDVGRCQSDEQILAIQFVFVHNV